jgi:hypothetical protein
MHYLHQRAFTPELRLLLNRSADAGVGAQEMTCATDDEGLNPPSGRAIDRLPLCLMKILRAAIRVVTAPATPRKAQANTAKALPLIYQMLHQYCRASRYL